jgi:methylase of polypeptide subunit release factors
MYSIAAAYFEPAEIVAFDIDEGALKVARENLDSYELAEKVKIMQGDIL